MKFGLSRDLDDIIICSNFGVDRLRGFRSVRVRKWPFLYLSTIVHKTVYGTSVRKRDEIAAILNAFRR